MPRSPPNQTLQLRRSNWALKAYARSSLALRADAAPELIAASVCEAIVDIESYVLAAIALPEVDAEKSLRLIGGAGPAIGYLDNLVLSWSESRPEGAGPTGRAIRSGRPVIVRDTHAESIYAPWRARGDKHGIRSSVTVPFHNGGEVRGAIIVYAPQPDAFGLDELGVFQQLGDDLAFAMRLADEREQLKAARTARKAAEDAMRDAQSNLMRVARISTLGEFAASMAHEINQPMTAIRLNGQAALRWLTKAPPDIEEAAKAVERAIADADRATNVISRLRNMVTNADPEHFELDLNTAVRDVIDLTEHELRRAQIEVVLDLSDGECPTVGDNVQLQQVILNLVTNSIEAMRLQPAETRRLIVRTHASETVVAVAIEDRGPGLDPTAQKRLFEQFFTTKSGGTGLGLAISRTIVEAHGGSIHAEAAAPSGARFVFTLPRASERAARKEPTSPGAETLQLPQ